MNKLISLLLVFVVLAGLTACKDLSKDRTGPAITNIQTSGKVLVISDCAGTTVTISADVTDPSGVEKVSLWYRTGDEQQFSSLEMKQKDGSYQASLSGPDFLGRPYGTLEFYITAEDGMGNINKSPANQSIQFLPCVNN